MSTVAELDALDREVAELRGWKWDKDMGWVGEGSFNPYYQPTRDARQAMALLEELAAADVVLDVLYTTPRTWECCVTVSTGWSEHAGDSPCEAIVRAWIAWKRAT